LQKKAKRLSGMRQSLKKTEEKAAVKVGEDSLFLIAIGEKRT